MTRRRLTTPVHDLRRLFGQVRNELAVPDSFPVQVEAAALEAASRGTANGRRDLTAIPFVTVDPVGSMDLDQAFHLERVGAGVRVRYAIADVAAVVDPGGPVDVESHVRGVTLYSPDLSTPLHPRALSEGAASLLPGEVRAAVVWTVQLDEAGASSTVHLERATVRSTRRLDYESVQRDLDSDTEDEQLVLLREVGEQRLAAEAARGGMSLKLPEQEVVPVGSTWTLRYRRPLPCEAWNAQLSLLTGICAARIMLDGGVGVLRTMPDADRRDVERLRRVARGLGVDWAPTESYASLVTRLDGSTPQQAAFLDEASALFRGAAYTVVGDQTATTLEHAAVAAPYAHVTAPLRRLVDRYATEACLALVDGREPPGWIVERLPVLPEVMARAGRRQGELERACLEVMEAVMLEPLVGRVVAGVVVDEHPKGGGIVMLDDPAVLAKFEGDVRLGDAVSVRVTEADPETRRVRLSLA